MCFAFEAVLAPMISTTRRESTVYIGALKAYYRASSPKSRI